MSEAFIDLKCNKSCRHIRELEQQLSELKESRKQKQIIRLCNRLDKAEQQNEQMLDILKEITDYLTPNNKNYIGCKSILHRKVDDVIEAVTDKSTDELLK